MKQAARIAINRTVAGVHYPVDSMAGQLLGMSVADYFMARLKPTGSTTNVGAWGFDGTPYPGATDFSGAELFDTTADVRNTTAYAAPITSIVGGVATPVSATVQGSANLNWLWAAAAAEW